MSRLAYVNGRYLPLAQAGVSVEDRGFQLSDGVYEVWAVFGGRLADPAGHLDRLERSLGELRMAMPMARAALIHVLHETVRRNRVRDGLVYLQVTRGRARRDHAFPTAPTAPTVVVTARSLDMASAQAKAATGVKVVTQPETRWARCDIKTIGLLPNVLAKQAAKDAGADEAWFVDDDGLVTEGASTNAWILDQDGVLRTRSARSNILRGVTRSTLLDLAEEQGLKTAERAFTVAEAQGAREAFITAASSLILPVVAINGVAVGDGRPGPVARRLRELYRQNAIDTAI